MKQQRVEKSQYAHQWKEFKYVSEMTRFFNENPELQLMSFCLGRQNMFVAIYKEPADFSNDK